MRANEKVLVGFYTDKISKLIKTESHNFLCRSFKLEYCPDEYWELELCYPFGWLKRSYRTEWLGEPHQNIYEMGWRARFSYDNIPHSWLDSNGKEFSLSKLFNRERRDAESSFYHMWWMRKEETLREKERREREERRKEQAELEKRKAALWHTKGGLTVIENCETRSGSLSLYQDGKLSLSNKDLEME